jgi:hypothetical protein
MNRTPLSLIGLLALAACGQPSRSYAWFQAHPDEAAKVATACGASHSDDCRNAQKVVADVQALGRLETYRKAF